MTIQQPSAKRANKLGFELYQMSTNFTELLDMANDPSRDEQAIIDTLESMEGEMQEVGVQVMQVVESLETSTTGIDQAIKRLQDRKSMMVNRAKTLRRILAKTMQNAGIKKIECPIFSITCLPPKASVEITDEEKIPAQYIEVQVVNKVDKKALLADLKAEVAIEGAQLKYGDPSLLVK